MTSTSPNSGLLFLGSAVAFSALYFLRGTQTPAPKKSDTKVLVDPAIHSKLYEMMDYFHRLTRKHNIKYFIAFGTLLGAVREKNIIKWDDDIDLMIEKSELEKLRNLDQREFGPYVLDFRDHIWRLNSKTHEYPYIDLFEVEVRTSRSGEKRLAFTEPGNLSRWSDSKYGIPLRDVYPLTDYRLGPLTLKGPRNFDAVLTRAYGDYMTPVYWGPHRV